MAFAVATDAEIRSHKNKVGDEVTATVANDVKDPSGQVVIPGGLEGDPADDCHQGVGEQE